MRYVFLIVAIAILSGCARTVTQMKSDGADETYHVQGASVACIYSGLLSEIHRRTVSAFPPGQPLPTGFLDPSGRFAWIRHNLGYVEIIEQSKSTKVDVWSMRAWVKGDPKSFCRT